MSLKNYIPKSKKAIWFNTFPGQRQRTLPKPREIRQRKPIRKKSSKQAKSDRLYNAQAKKYLFNDGIGRMDMVALALQQGAIKATCVHHKRGRLGTLKFDERFWIPTTMQNSLWPHTHINEARRKKLIANQGDWHLEPGDWETKRIRMWMGDNGLYDGAEAREL